MSAPLSEQRAVALRSGNVCAFPDCGKSLILDGPAGESVINGEIAHIVGDSRQGPRGRSPLTAAERDRADNLIYLCEAHHKLIDRHPQIYSVAVLQQMKCDHEERIRKVTEQKPLAAALPLVSEQIHSTLLRVVALPAAIYAAPCAFVERQEKDVFTRLVFPKAADELVPFLLRDKKLFSFHDPRIKHSPFREVVDCRRVEEIPIFDFAGDPEGRRRLTALLNSSMRRFMTLKNLGYDKVHHRYFFRVDAPGKEREYSYHTITGRNSSRMVVWQPKRRSTGEGKNHWLHLAAALNFHELAEKEWGFSIRIERHLTTNGETPFPSEYVGRKVTRLKARMFNDAYLKEVHFWRDFLSGGKPRFILNYGNQSCVVESELISCSVKWPGIPEDAQIFTNQEFSDDLFSLAEFQAATSDRDSEWELEMEEKDDE